VKNRRKNYLIEHKFQLRVFWKFLLMVTFASVLTGSLVYFYIYYKQRTNIASVYYVTEKLGEVVDIKEPMEIVLLSIILSELVTIFVTAIFVLFYSHRMAGPIYRFKRVFEEVGRGNFNVQIYLRKNDEFKDLAESFNKMTFELSEKFNRFK